MSSKLITYGLVLRIILSGSPDMLIAQPTSAPACHEHVVAFTDRSLYISGEKILFSAWITDEEPGWKDKPGRVLYLELITPDGSKVNTGKYSIAGGRASGGLDIPRDALSGNYYLKAYTRWMRNQGPGAYHYTLIRIVNPYRDEVLSGQEFKKDSAGNFAGACKPAINAGFRLTADKAVYQPRERVRFTVESNAGRNDGMFFCVSGMPSVALRDSISIPRDSISNSARYLPETRGVSVSGSYTETHSGQPLANARVNLSIIGDKDMMATLTNPDGQFYFALPDYSGTRDIFLSGENVNGNEASILIDNDFCTQAVNLPAPVFHLTAEERVTVLKMAANQKVEDHFRLPVAAIDTLLSHRPGSFYGKPDEVLFLDKYIDLPTLEDYFHELVGSVGVRKHEGRKIFRFNSYKVEMNIYDPLVMVDWVVIDDMEKLLSVSPRGIERIELIKVPWLKGSITYGGIISIISKKGDFAGIDLPASGTFVNYQFLSENSIPELNGPVNDQKPDARNTICWIPDLKLDNSGRASFEFYTPDTPGNYVIVLSGLSLQGDEIFVIKEIEVR